jgi:surface antigen
MSDEGTNGESLPARHGLASVFARRRPGKHRKLTARTLPAILLVGGAVPIAMGISATPNAAQRPSSILCQGYSGCTARGYSGHGYGQASSKSYWRMTAGNECTNYTAFVESTVYRAGTPRYLLGNGGQWAQAARAHGVTVNRTPAVGAVAEWNGGTFGMGPLGHVAVVERVGPHDRYIVISQQHINSEADGYDWTRINAGHSSDQWQEWPSSFIHFPLAARHAGVGYFSPASHSFRLRGSLSSGPASLAFSFGGSGVIPLTGRWTARGYGAGYYSPGSGTFHLRAGLRGGKASDNFSYGPAGMIPLAGDWTGSGTDSVGYYDPRNGTFHLREQLSSGRTYRTFAFGPPGMIPLAGDWNGSRQDGIGYYNPRNGWFHLRDSPSAGPASDTVKFGPGHMIPLAANWTGGSRDGIGYYNPRDGWFHLRAGKDGRAFRFGPAHMVPVAGDWPAA